MEVNRLLTCSCDSGAIFGSNTTGSSGWMLFTAWVMTEGLGKKNDRTFTHG